MLLENVQRCLTLTFVGKFFRRRVNTFLAKSTRAAELLITSVMDKLEPNLGGILSCYKIRLEKSKLIDDRREMVFSRKRCVRVLHHTLFSNLKAI